MGVYDTLQYAIIYCDKLFDTQGIHARVCSVCLNEPIKSNGHSMQVVYENNGNCKNDSLISYLVDSMQL